MVIGNFKAAQLQNITSALKKNAEVIFHNIKNWAFL